VRLQTLIWFYGRRLRVHWMQELLAGLGIAIGVALVLSVQVANSSITASAHQELRAITGDATLQLAARDPHGIDARYAALVAKLPSVLHAAPALEQRAVLHNGSRSVPVNVIGVDASLKALGGSATAGLLLGGVALEHGLLLPTTVAHALGVPAGAADGQYHARVSVRGRNTQASVSGVFGPGTIGEVSNASLAVMYLPYAQRLVGLPGRISRVLVVPRRGQEQLAKRELTALAAGRATVAPAGAEATMLAQAAAPNDQATSLFAAVSALVGLLFAFNAMLLTMPERRAAAAELLIEGYRSSQLALIMLFQTFVLGAVASAVGLGAGTLLADVAARNPPAYLAFAFPAGTHRIVPLTALVLAWIGGVAAACFAGVGPLVDLRQGFATRETLGADAEPGHGLSSSTRGWLALAGLVLAISTSVLVLIAPSTALVAILGIAVATVLAIPLAFTVVLSLVAALAQRWRWNPLVLAVRAVRATPIRSLALAATGAVAVFGSVAIEGAHRDLLRGLRHSGADVVGTADIWVTAGGDQDGLTTDGFQARDIVARLRRLPDVANARPYYGGFVDTGGRRLWITGRPVADRTLIPPSQLKAGVLNTANALMRRGGWVAASESVLRAQHAHLGGALRLPTPSGTRDYRVAATLTNLGWGPGALLLSSRDYTNAWPAADPSAIEVNLRPGTSPALGRREVIAALPPGSALDVQTRAQRGAEFRRLARQGLTRLSQISTLLLIAAAFAMAAAMGAGIWQRRVALARMRIDGFTPMKLWQTLLLETAVVLGVGCGTGAVTGIYGHLLGARWLELSTGFPAPSVVGLAQPILTSLIVAAVALAITLLPGLLASRTPARVGLQQ
jgi:putative ABC transport system permease protein